MAALLNQGFEQMGVAPETRTMVASRMPSLVGSAHAATLSEQAGRSVARARTVAAPGNAWGIQVGSYASEKAARDAALNARRASDGGDARIESTSWHGKTAWRAQVLGLSAAEAQGACSALAHRGTPCVVLRPDQRQVASR